MQLAVRSRNFGTRIANSMGMLRITIHEPEREATVQIVLEGRIAGPWATELDRVWAEAFPRLGSRKLVLDLRGVTYADATGKSVLAGICVQGKAELITGTLQSEDLVHQLTVAELQA